MKSKHRFMIFALACMIACVFGAFGLTACGETVKPSDGHTHNYQWVDNGDGTHKQHCNVSGCDEPDKNVGSHKYENGACVCGAKKSSEHTHNFNQKNTDEKYLKSEATCTEHAIYYHSCTCGEKGTETFEDGNLKEHTFTTYTYNNDATCIADGTETAKCENCNEHDTRTSATHLKTGIHNYRDGVCAVCGKIDDDAPTTKGLAYTAVYDENDGSNIIGYSVSKGSAAQKEYIKIPDTYKDKPVIAIEDRAFEQCWQLKNITIPNSITSIGKEAFGLCQKLTSITIPDSVGSIGSYVFSDCDGLKEITVRSGNKRYHSSGNCIIETASKTLIAGCKTSVIPNDGSVTSIGDYAFYCCRNITDVTIPNGVTSIGKNAFYLCGSLSKITIPDGLTSIGSSAFLGCKAASISIPNSVTSIGADAFSDCYDLTEITVQSGNKRYHGSGNCIIETASKTLIAGCKSSVIPNDGSVTSVGYRAFYDCSGLTSMTIPVGVTSIGDEAFFRCANLMNITIPNGVTNIGYHAFYGCVNLTSINIPDSVVSIDYDAFYDCDNLQFNLYDNGSYLGNEANKHLVFVKALRTDISSCKIHNDTKVICGSAFRECGSLTSITIPNKVTSIGDTAFWGCRSLTSVTIGSGVKIIEVGAFMYCENLTSITIPDGVTRIEEYVFMYCSNLTNVTIPDSVTSIGTWAFYVCNKLKYNEYENGLYLGNNENKYIALIRAKSASISSFTIHNNTKVIYESAFSGCKDLTSVTIPVGVTSIGDRAFSGCGVTSISIPSSVTSIGDNAFSDCANLAGITVQSGNTKYHGSGNCIIETASKTLIAGCKTSVIPNDGSVTSIGRNAFRDCSGLTSVVIPNIVTSIGSSAFSGCGITSITIPDGVTSIGDYAFSGCDGLAKITVQSGNTKYHGSGNCIIETASKTLIAGCKTSVIPNDGSVMNVAKYAFFTCVGLTSISIPNGVTSIDDAVFSGCTGLTSVTIPDSVTEIEVYALSGCSSLTSISFDGTMAQWSGIHKHSDWISGAREYTIHCTDGDILKSES